MKAARLQAFAKLNYALEVQGVRGDGYHEISTVMQSISLADELEITRTREGFELVVEPGGVEVGPLEENTVYKVRKALERMVGVELPARIWLGKEIPAGAGLGGSSADAAATLVGLNEIFDLGLSEAELRVAGLMVGADVPFCIMGGTALGEGIGEILSPLPGPPPHRLVVAKPAAGASTARVYNAYDDRAKRERNAYVAPVAEALRTGDLEAMSRALGNDLTGVTEEIVPEVRALREGFLRAGAMGAAMSGTGTAVFGVLGADVEAEGVATRPGVHFVRVCEPVYRGVTLLQVSS